ncbi:hypothetical protein [Oryzobacter terrae]|uniref:hypothetical protein n=1 Tax=Oryzobacter terrae TaxID=1620385 RepID=UPI0036725964
MTDAPREVTTSYTSTEAVIEREARVLWRRQLSRPGFWRGFVLRRVALSVVVVVLLVVVEVAEVGGPGAALRGGLVLVPAFLALLALDVWMVRRRTLRAHRVLTRAGCPPGTVVTAAYRPDEVEFTLPTHRVALPLSTVTSAVHGGGVLVLVGEDEETAWVVPDELLGDEAVRVLRAALGTRLVER